MPAAWISAGAAVIGAYSSSQKSSGGSPGNAGAAAAADPFANQRPQYQTQLSNLMANPSSVTQTPGYEFTLAQGLSGAQASSDAMGLGRSGANDAGRIQYAEGLANSTYQQDFNNLAMLSGANQGNLGAASQAVTAGNNNVSAGIGTVAGAVGKGVSNWMNQSSTTGTGGTGGTSSVVVDPTTYQTPTFQTQNIWGGGSSSGGSVGFNYGGS